MKHRFYKIAVLAMLASCMLISPTHAEAPTDPSLVVPGGLDVMNDIRFDDYKDFEKKWHFVTVRYRKDTGEMRFTYANNLAWKMLLEKNTDYPDGAAFAKTGLMTSEDPAFASSVVPSGAARLQIMVRDKKKYASTHGWGYAIFNSNGKTFDLDPISHQTITAAACNACHEVVPDRGYVFSQPISVGGARPEMLMQDDAGFERLVFETAPVSELPQKIRDLLPKDFSKIRLLRGPMELHIFQGTLGEIRPALVQELMKSGMPAALVEKKGGKFSLVYSDTANPQCTLPNGDKGTGLQAVYTTTPPGNNLKTYPISETALCSGSHK